MRKKECRRVLILATACLLLLVLSGCGGTQNYALRKSIEDIAYAEIADVTSDETERIESIEVLAKLDAAEAQALAGSICSLECKYTTPPVYVLEGISAIFYYSDGSYEIVSQQGNRYISGTETKYGCRIFDFDEFSDLLNDSI